MREDFVVDHDGNDSTFRIESAHHWDLPRDDPILPATVGLVEQMVQRRAWVVVRVAVVETHVLEVRTNMLVEETLHFVVIEIGVDEDCAYVRFDNIGKALGRV